jgi:hypothetical protein
MFRIRLLAISCLWLLYGCGGDTTQRNTYVTGSDAGQKGTVVGQLQIEDGAPATVVAGATVTVQDHPELVSKTAADGSFQIPNAPAGTLNVIITASTTGLATADYGVKIDAVKVKPQEKTDLGKQTMKKTGSLTGLVTFFDNPNNLDLAGSDVYIPGTDFIAKTDSQGSFTLAGLPEGTYTLKMQHSGFSTTTLEAVSITSGEVTDLGTVPLSLSLGPEGDISLQSDATASIGGKVRKIRLSRTVTVNLNYDGDAALMKVSADPTFLNTSWEPVKKALEWTFDSDGEKTLYVTFADLNGLESSPFADSVFVDTEVPTISEVKIMEGWAQTATTAVYLDVTGSDTGTGIQQIMLSNDANFTGASWQTFTSRLNWTVTSGAGPKTIYAKVKDYAGNVSSVASDAINKGDYTLIHNSTYTSKVTLYKEQSPYLVTDTMTFGSDLEIKPGATLYIESNRSVTVKGVFTSKGTASEEILISLRNPAAGSCGGMGIEGYTMDFSQTLPGVSSSNVIQYTRFQLAEFLQFNGGTVTNNHFDASLCTVEGHGGLIKSGMDNLLVSGNTFTKWKNALTVQNGIANSTFSNNTGTIISGISQTGEATGTVIKNNTIQWIENGGAIYSPGSGSFTIENNTWSGTPYYGWFISGSGNITINGFDFTSAQEVLSISGTGTVTVNGGTITSCTTLFSVRDSAKIVANGVNASGCSKAVDHQYYSAGEVTINSSTLSVSSRLVFANSYSSTTTTLSGNTITCSTGTGTCDLFYKEPMNDDEVYLTLENNTIHCTTVGNCRGFVFEIDYTAMRTQDFDLALTSNTFVGKSLNNDLKNNTVQTTNTSAIDPEVKIFLIAPGGGSITLNATVSQ